ncbi:MAG: glycosyltransferase family 2 protein [Gemmatimonadales bacterium]|nr:glycosyltransferase family 2 protein [Gemmatimonadales bacterium]
MTPTASVIVPTYNRPNLLERVVRALLSQVPATAPYEVVIVDDGSGPDTQAAVRQAAGSDPRAVYLRHNANRGRSAARNTGIHHSRGQIVLFVDDDVVVEHDYVGAHLRAHEAAAPDRVAVMGDLRFPPEVVRASNYAKYLQSRYLGGRDLRALTTLRPADLHPRFLITAACSMRRDDLVAAGTFDESIRFYGCEDHILAHALKRAGVRIVFAPEARALHHDTVAIGWYRAKMLEAARDGVPVLLRDAPEFLEETGFADLLPVNRERDSGVRIGRKLALRAALNPLTLVALERWASATDHIGWLYSPLACRALSAGWFLRGLAMASNGPRLVVYGT